LSYGTPQQVHDACRTVLEGVARDGGFILDASAIIQNDAQVANIRAMTEATRQYGVYADGYTPEPAPVGRATAESVRSIGRPSRTAPGVCIAWEQQKKQLPPVCGDAALAQRIWEQVDALGNTFIWQLLLSF
jgi:hypothetical protein